ncbi:vacuolar protein-sorting protein VPS25 [Acrasis kona]|uniref:ESCRT-II complex subunit VPS25 n=1 Tax=Acrasis kona TaxID=1008807 RepID=A0AAW2ZA43_9EUKA
MSPEDIPSAFSSHTVRLIAADSSATRKLFIMCSFVFTGANFSRTIKKLRFHIGYFRGFGSGWTLLCGRSMLSWWSLLCVLHDCNQTSSYNRIHHAIHPLPVSVILSAAPVFYVNFIDRLQPVVATRQKQIKLWSELILNYCQKNTLYKLNLDQAEKLDLFRNDAIQRSLSREAIIVFLDALVEQGKAEWIDAKRKDEVSIYWKTPTEWADIIQKWVAETGYSNTVLTVYELIEGDTGEKTEFFGLDGDIFRKAIGVLERRGKAELFQGTTSDQDGVKFLNI